MSEVCCPDEPRRHPDTFPASSHEAALDTAMLLDQEQDGPSPARRQSKPCAGLVCDIGAITGRGCDGNEKCALEVLNDRGVIIFPVENITGDGAPADAVPETADPSWPVEAVVARWIDKHGYPPPHVPLRELCQLANRALLQDYA